MKQSTWSASSFALMHLFLIEGDLDSGVFVKDDLRGVEEFNKKRVSEITVAADYFNKTSRIPPAKTMRRLLQGVGR